MKIRTVTAFATLQRDIWDSSITPRDSTDQAPVPSRLNAIIANSCTVTKQVAAALNAAGFEVQTTRIALNNPCEWLPVDSEQNFNTALDVLDDVLASHQVDFCSLGRVASKDAMPAMIARLTAVVQRSPRFNVSVDVEPTSEDASRAAAVVAVDLAASSGGQDNFRFCTSRCIQPFLPFFPGARSADLDECEAMGGSPNSVMGFAIGLENGDVATAAMTTAGRLDQVTDAVTAALTPVVQKIEKVCQAQATALNCVYRGIDTSLNPSLEDGGSIASAFEKLTAIPRFGAAGTMAAVTATTRALQSLGCTRVGYCGLMLPVCEDRRLAELSSHPAQLSIAQLLMLSACCGVGIDTVPVPGNVSVDELAALYLDVASLAERWSKPLSCRVFPVPGRRAGDMTAFDSPYLVNGGVLSISA